jgi:hypothetical protein
MGKSTYCFTTRAEAEFVQVHFGGEFVDPNNLGAVVAGEQREQLKR